MRATLPRLLGSVFNVERTIVSSMFFFKFPMSQVAWEVVQEFLQRIFGKDFRLSMKNIIMGVCNKKGLDSKGRKFFSCVIAQMVALLARIYYRRAKVGQDGIIRLVNWGLDLCLALGWNKGFRTYMGRGAEVQSVRGLSLNMRTRVIK